MIKASFGGLTKVAIQHTPNFMSEVLNAITRILLSFLGYSVISIVYSHLCFSCLTLIVMIYYVKKIPVKIPDLRYYKIYFKLALPMSLITIIYTLNSTVDKLILYKYFGGIDLALYTSGFRFAQMLSLIGMLVSGVTYPYLSKYYHKKDFKKLSEISHKTENFLTIIIIPLILTSLVYSDYIVLGLLGTEFSGSTKILRLFSIGIYFFVLFHPLHILLGSMEKFLTMTLLQIFLLVLNLFLCHFLSLDVFISIHGLNLGYYGIALSVVIIYFFSLIMYKLISCYYLSDWRFATLGIQSIYLFVIYIFLVKEDIFAEMSLIIRLAYLFLMIIINYTFHYLFGHLKLEDIKMIFNIINPRESIKYIKSELLMEEKNES